ncbi:MAG: type IX secretion system membrane protein PorP/SprF [Bacteroidetes bacterium]|nr:type IX secretion system membrane protein PorP/SprF [Bacteroidota bacterium]
MKIKLYTLFVLMLCYSFFNAQQQTLFTNITLHQYLYNPAYAGSSKGMQFNMGYRNQWAGFDGAPTTYMASGYGTLKKKPNMAIGGLIINDKSGLLSRTSFYGSYSYHVKLSKKVNLGFGISAGAVQYNVKIYNAKTYDKDDEFLKNNILNANAFDANAGLYLYSKNFFMGLSSQQLTKGKIYWMNTIGRLTPHLYGYMGYNFQLDKKKKEWVLQPSMLIRYNNPSPYQLEFNLKCIYKEAFWIAGGYRVGASASAMFGATISKQFTVGYSYDYATTALQKYSSGSHEIILTYTKSAKKIKTVGDKIQDADEEELNNIDNSIKTNLKNKKNDEKK